MSTTIVSTTDSPEAVQSATLGELATEKVVEETPATTEEKPKVEEKIEDSEPSKDELKAKDEETDEEDPTEKPKKKGGYQKKAERFQKQLTERELELEFWKAKAMETKSPEAAKPVIKTDGKPKADDFATHEDFIEALTDWKVEQKDLEKTVNAKESQVRAEIQKQRNSFQARLDEFKDTTEDFDEVVSETDDIPLSFGVHDAILTSELGPQIMYELAKNRKEFERINALTPTSAAREIGKIEARLVKTEKPEPEKVDKKTTKAPQPLAPIGSKGAKVAKSIDDPSLTQREYERLREAQLAQDRA